MFKNPIALAVLALVVIGGGVWLYLYSTNPLNSSCRKLLADWDRLGPPAADALYDSLTPEQQTKTTRVGTRMYLDTVCQTETEQEDLTVSEIRERMDKNLSAH